MRRDAVFVGAEFLSYVDSLRRDVRRCEGALRAASLSGPVRGVLVTVGARLSVHEPAADVIAVRHDELVAWLRAQPHLVDASAVAELHRRLARPTSWGSARVAPPAPEWVAELARGLAAEHALAPTPPRRPEPAAPAPGSYVWRFLSAVAVLVCLLIGAPVAIALAWLGLSAGWTPKPAQTPTYSAGVTSGSTCAVSGSTGVDPAGTPLVCRRVTTASTTVLLWTSRG
jgi:hypothetical protein